MFVPNVFNFASEGKCYRYGSVNMPLTKWGPWHTPDHKAEGSLADVRISIADMLTPEKVMDLLDRQCSIIKSTTIKIYGGKYEKEIQHVA